MGSKQMKANKNICKYEKTVEIYFQILMYYKRITQSLFDLNYDPNLWILCFGIVFMSILHHTIFIKIKNSSSLYPVNISSIMDTTDGKR